MAEPAFSDEQVRELVVRLEQLLERLEGFPGPGSDLAMAAIEALTDLYGTALQRIVAMVSEGRATVSEFAADELIGHLMLLHGLHPDPAEDRIRRALAEVSGQLGGETHVEFTEIDDGVARLRLRVAGCQSSAGALAEAVGDVVLAAAPELRGVEPVTARPPAKPALIPVDALLHRPGAPS